ncbi:MAG: YlmC/YmxH family sporulation protein [Lachnospiraceae bacterium]|jgi:YlmC/YmxH family sporulation protein|nr:YlmC/YmxH family sporulation protein [Lachnospiraceae bacterium]
MKFTELRQKEVINCKDCMKLGCVADLDFDICSGQICGLIVPEPVGLFSNFCKSNKYYIPFCDVVRIGPDIILVDICPDNAVIKEKDCG